MRRKLDVEDEKTKLLSYKRLQLKRKDITFMLIILVVIILRYFYIIRFSIIYPLIIVVFGYLGFTLKDCVKMESYEYNKKISKLLKDGEVVGEYIPDENQKALQKISSTIICDRFILGIVLFCYSFGGIAVCATVASNKFLENADSTMAIVEAVSKDIKTETVYDDEKIKKKYIVIFTYDLSYDVNGNIYNYKLINKEKHTSKDSARDADANYKKNDEIKIYYQKDDPNDVKFEIIIITDWLINVFIGIPLVIELATWYIMDRKYKKDCDKIEFGL